MSNLRYPIGIQSFSEIREGGYIYIDKPNIYIGSLRKGNITFSAARAGSANHCCYPPLRSISKGIVNFSTDSQYPNMTILGTNIPYCILICRVAQLIRTTVCPHLLRIFFYDGRMNMTYLQTMIYPIASDLRRLLSKRINRPAIR